MLAAMLGYDEIEEIMIPDVFIARLFFSAYMRRYFYVRKSRHRKGGRSCYPNVKIGTDSNKIERRKAMYKKRRKRVSCEIESGV